jgi:SSS family transporter
MNSFNALDWGIVLLYLAGIILFGISLGKGQKTTRDYFLGSRSVSWWGVGVSIVATETSALTFIGIPALAYGSDWSLLQIILGYVIARVVLAWVLVPHYFRGEIYSPYQLITRALGPGAGRLAGGMFLISGTLAAGVRVYVTSIPVQLMLGIDLFSAILLFVLLSWTYTYVGGIKAVIWTDVIQFLLFMAGGVFTVLYVPALLKGGWGGMMDPAAAAGKLHWLNLSFSWGMPFNLWMGILGGTFQVLSSHGADQLIVQRVLTCRSVADGRRALILSAAIILPLFLLFLATGTGLWAYYQEHPLAMPLPANSAGLVQNDYIYPIFILTVIPHAIKGFLMVAILSAAMSSVSSALSALAAVSTMDFAGVLRGPQAGGPPTLLWSRLATVFWAVMLIGVAYASREAELVLNLAFSLSGITSGALLGGLLLAVFLKPPTARPLWAGILGSVGTMVGIHFWIHFYAKDAIAWPWFTLIGTLATLGIAGVTWGLESACKVATCGWRDRR